MERTAAGFDAENGSVTTVAHVRDQIRGLIHQGVLVPGERINEQALAGRLQVGRALTREALRSLEPAGLVRIVPNRGAEVCRLSLEDVLHLYDVRAGLARAAGRLVASRMTSTEESKLRRLLAEMEAAAQAHDAAQYQHWNDRFHEALVQVTKNPRLVALNQAVEDELRLYLSKGVFTLAQIRISLAEHRAMLATAVEGQPEQAARAFEQHVLTGKQRMLDTVASEMNTAGAGKGSDA